jgi:hypothetical protein
MNIVLEYVTEEVERQGFDLTTTNGLWRVVWMLDAWYTAQKLYAAEVNWIAGRRPILELKDVILLGKLVEPVKNANGIRIVQVTVGDHIPPLPSEIPSKLQRWLEMQLQMTSLEAYKEFEIIHPFVDGNGRVGKIILNWLLNSLRDPIFPPNDLWGKPIRNP